MTKKAKIISIFFTLIFVLSNLAGSASASTPSIASLLKKRSQELQKEPPQTQIKSFGQVKEKKDSSTSQSQDSNSYKTQDEPEEAQRKERVQKLLDALDKWYQRVKGSNIEVSPTPTPIRDAFSAVSYHTADVNYYLGKPQPIVVLLSQNASGQESFPNPETKQKTKSTTNIPISKLLASAYKQIKANNNTGETLAYKKDYTIALLGDSMTDTLGQTLFDLHQLLINKYPGKTFTLLNYGQGSTDLEDGLERLVHESTYLEKTYPPLLEYKPDILVVESFAYNHWSGQKHDLDRHWLTLAKIIDTVKLVSPETQIILAATISPNSDIFGDGVLNWPKELKYQSTLITKAYLQNLTNFATSQGFPLADAYHPSMDESGQGLPIYINSSDNLHPSDEGKLLFSQKVVETIKEYDLIR